MNHNWNTGLVNVRKISMSLLKRVDYRGLLGCLGLTIILWLAIWAELFRPTKRVLEIIGVALPGLFTLALVLRFAFSRHKFFLWGAGLMGLLTCREIHFSGTDVGIYVGLLVLLGIVLVKYDAFKSYLVNRVLINLLAMGFLFYFISQTTDQRWWQHLPGENAVFVPLEEFTEVLGHFTVGLALAFCKEARQPERATPAAKLLTPNSRD